MNNVVIYSYNKHVGRTLCAMWCNYQEDTIHLLLCSVIVVGEIFSYERRFGLSVCCLLCLNLDFCRPTSHLSSDGDVKE